MCFITRAALNMVSNPQVVFQQNNNVLTRCGSTPKPPENNNTCCKPDDGKNCHKPDNDWNHCNKPNNDWNNCNKPSNNCHKPNNNWDGCNRPDNNWNSCNRPGNNGNNCSGSNNHHRPGNDRNDCITDTKSILRQLSDMLEKLSRQAGRDLKAASGSNDPFDVLKANRSMSNYYLNNQFVSKMISKMTSSVERMTNLQ